MAQNSFLLRMASQRLRNDREFIMELIKVEGSCDVRQIGEGLRDDKEIILEAMRQGSRYVLRRFAMSAASPRLKLDKELVLTAIANSGSQAKYVLLSLHESHLRDDPEVVLAAIMEDAGALEEAGPTAKNHRETVMAAVTRNGWALQYAGDNLKRDRGLVLEAVAQDCCRRVIDEVKITDHGRPGSSYPLSLRESGLLDDKDIILTVLKNRFLRDIISVLWYIDQQHRDDFDIMKAAVQRNASALRYASDRLKQDRDLVKVLAATDGDRLPYQFKDDDEIVLIAVRQNGKALRRASDRLQRTEAVVQAAVEQAGADALIWVPHGCPAREATSVMLTLVRNRGQPPTDNKGQQR